MNIQLDNITKRYDESPVIDQMSLTVEDVSCLSFLGPSGGGKSTTLRLIAGLESVSAGSVTVNGTSLNDNETLLLKFRRRIGVVFQAFNLFPHLDAVTNISLPLEKVHGYSPSDATARADSLLEKFKLIDHRLKKPAELSGGQNQRIAIARALSHEPELLLLDEPTSALDPEMTGEVLDTILEIKDEGRDVLLVTHQIGFAKQISDRTAIIADGKPAEYGDTQQVIDNPQSSITQRFLERALKY